MQQTQISIQKACKSDLPAILSMYAQPGLDVGKVLSNEDAENLFDRINSYPNYKLYVAVQDSRIVGTFALLIMDNIGHLGKPSGIVEDVAVDPDFQGQGIGKIMMEFALNICRINGCYKLVLSSNKKRKTAHEFYESLGFNKHGFSFRIDTSEYE